MDLGLEDSSNNDVFSTAATPTTEDECEDKETPQTLLYHIANFLFLISYSAPNNSHGQIWMHTGLILGYLIFSAWAWNVICAPDVFAWYFVFMILNIGQLLYILYQLRPIKFDSDLEKVYENLFAPLQVTRMQFKRLVSVDAAQIANLHAGECYAIEGLTKTDRLGLLLTGRVNVMNEKTFLHNILPEEFLDSPEFESSNSEEIFKVSICAAEPSKYIVWQRQALEYIFVKDPYLAQITNAIISQDITDKLFRMNSKVLLASEKSLDIRLPGIASRIFQMDNREHTMFRTNNKIK